MKTKAMLTFVIMATLVLLTACGDNVSTPPKSTATTTAQSERTVDFTPLPTPFDTSFDRSMEVIRKIPGIRVTNEGTFERSHTIITSYDVYNQVREISKKLPEKEENFFETHAVLLNCFVDGNAGSENREIKKLAVTSGKMKVYIDNTAGTFILPTVTLYAMASEVKKSDVSGVTSFEIIENHIPAPSETTKIPTSALTTK